MRHFRHQQITQAAQHHENMKSRTLAMEVSTSATKKSANVIGCAKSTITVIVTNAWICHSQMILGAMTQATRKKKHQRQVLGKKHVRDE